MMRFFWPIQGEPAQIEQLNSLSPLQPFHTGVIQFITGLSQRLVKLRQHPELVALGYWMRKANINALHEQWLKQTEGSLVKARGTVFHIAPSNVDTIFVYSWMLSLLGGNRNVIRISSKEQVQMNVLLGAILDMLAAPEHQEIAARTMVLTYEHDDDVTEWLSKQCHTRIVWGGDVTISRIRQIALAPMANELMFPDRFSLSLIKANRIATLDRNTLLQLAEQFYNDSFWFGQMACSSPRLVVWHGSLHEVELAQQRFWTALSQILDKKRYSSTAATQVQKLATSLWLATEAEVATVKQEELYTRVAFKEKIGSLRERHCGGGLFYELQLEEMLELAHVITDKDQTLSYFGYDQHELKQLALAVESRGIDRMVPIGKALEFQEIWDGQSFIHSLTRRVVMI